MARLPGRHAAQHNPPVGEVLPRSERRNWRLSFGSRAHARIGLDIASLAYNLALQTAGDHVVKTVHRASVPNLQNAAQGASRRIEHIYKTLQAEIVANTEPAAPAKRHIFRGRPRLPETVTYPTKAIEHILSELVTMQLELLWWSTPVDQRGKLDKPFSLR
jgi:hypothetical protein